MQGEGQELIRIHEFSLNLKPRQANALIASTIAFVLDFAKFSWSLEAARPFPMSQMLKLDLTCHPHVLDTFIAVVSLCEERDYASVLNPCPLTA